MKYKCIKILSSIVLSILIINYIGGNVLAAKLSHELAQELGIISNYELAANDTSTPEEAYEEENGSSYSDVDTEGAGTEGTGIKDVGQLSKGKEIEKDGKTYVVDGVYEDKAGKKYAVVHNKADKNDTGTFLYSEEGGKATLGESYKPVSNTDKTDEAVEKAEEEEKKSKIPNPGDGMGDAAAKEKEKKMLEEGQKSFLSDVIDGIVGILVQFVRIIGIAIGYGLQWLTTLVAESAEGSDTSEKTGHLVTPDHILFNRLAITDIDFFQGEKFGNITLSEGNPIRMIRKSIADWYNVLRTISIILLLLALIYVGIRLAISTVAEDKAKYKDWLKNWVVSMCLLLVLHYLIIGIIRVNNSFVNTIYEVQKSTLGNKDDGAIGKYVESLAWEGINTENKGIGSIAYVWVYIGIVALTFIFLVMYIKRMITIAFLVMISPIITITYSIDKLGDGKSQALNNWFRMFMESVLIQPFHCIIYLVFVATAMSMVQKLGTVAAGCFAIMCFAFVLKAEGMIKDIFELNKSKVNDGAGGSLALLAAGAAAAKWGASKLSGGKKTNTSNVNSSGKTGSTGNTGNNGTGQAVNTSAQTSNIGRQNLNNMSSTTNVPIINGRTGEVASNVQRNNTVGQSGNIIAGTADNYNSATNQFNNQQNNGTLGQGGTINPNANTGNLGNANNSSSIILQGQNNNAGNAQIFAGIQNNNGNGAILGANGQPIAGTNGNTPPMATTQTGESRSAQMANNALNNSGQTSSSSKPGITDRIINGAKTLPGKFVGAIPGALANAAIYGTAAAVGMATASVGLGIAAASGGSAKEVLGAGLAGGAAGFGTVKGVADKGKEKISTYLNERNINKGEKNLSDAYEDYKNSAKDEPVKSKKDVNKDGSYNVGHMAAKTNELMSKSDEEINQMPEGAEKAYARALHQMPVIYEDNGKDDPQRELIDTLQKLHSGKRK